VGILEAVFGKGKVPTAAETKEKALELEILGFEKAVQEARDKFVVANAVVKASTIKVAQSVAACSATCSDCFTAGLGLAQVESHSNLDMSEDMDCSTGRCHKAKAESLKTFNCFTRELWSAEKTKWCRENNHGLETTTEAPSASFNCFTRELWSAEKTKWCGENNNGLDTTTAAPSASFNCFTRELWSAEKTKWCGENNNGLDTTTEAPAASFNCFTREVWSAEKTKWCGENNNGLDGPTPDCWSTAMQELATQSALRAKVESEETLIWLESQLATST